MYLKVLLGASKKKDITFKLDKSEITAVCIDDFALKKRYRYGTVMIDINTHKVIDMIESREKDVVTKWELISYVKNLYLEKNYCCRFFQKNICS
ncbi:MAG: transposase [Clostridium sp.]